MPSQNFCLNLCYFAFISYSIHVSCHNCKWFGRSSLSLAKGSDRIFIRCITAEMKSSDSFDCYNPSGSDYLTRIGDCLSAPFFSADQINLRTTFITAYRLCVVPSGRRIMIFRFAFRTHWKFLHTGTFSVIGKRIQYRKSRSATGTVDKWMQISAVCRIIHFFLTLFTDCNIRRDKDLPFCFFTFYNLKRFIWNRMLFRFYIHF